MNLIIFLGLKLRFLFAVVCNLFDVEGSWVIFYYESLRVHKPPNAGLVFDEITNKLAKSHSEVDFQVPEYVFYIGNCFVNEFALAGLNYRTRSHAFHVGHILLDIGNLFRRVEVLFICYNPAVGIFILSPNSAANKCFRAIALDKLLYHGSLWGGNKRNTLKLKGGNRFCIIIPSRIRSKTRCMAKLIAKCCPQSQKARAGERLHFSYLFFSWLNK